MKRDFETKFAGWAFLGAALMLWGGWMLLPRHIGTYFVPEDFTAIYDQLWFWIWMYRIHIFGIVITSIALISLSTILSEKSYRVMLWPGVGITVAGSFVLALGSAFYYHFGAWGAGLTTGQSTAEVQQFIETLRLSNEYVTCLVRFGRVFSGVGLLLVGIALVKWKILNRGVGGLAVFIGCASIAITMGLPDDLETYIPIFHVKAIWLALMGWDILRHGVNLSLDEI